MKFSTRHSVKSLIMNLKVCFWYSYFFIDNISFHSKWKAVQTLEKILDATKILTRKLKLVILMLKIVDKPNNSDTILFFFFINCWSTIVSHEKWFFSILILFSNSNCIEESCMDETRISFDRSPLGTIFLTGKKKKKKKRIFNRDIVEKRIWLEQGNSCYI